MRISDEPGANRMGWIRFVVLLMSAASLAACPPEQAAEPERLADGGFTSELEAPQPNPANRLADPPPPPPPRPVLPGLIPLSDADIRSELGSGARCALTDGGPPLLVAIPGDSIVNDRGRIVHLKPEATDWTSLAEGGRFAADNLIVEIDAGAVIARHEELVERSTSVSIMRGRRGFSASHGPGWVCGSRGVKARRRPA